MALRGVFGTGAVGFAPTSVQPRGGCACYQSDRFVEVSPGVGAAVNIGDTVVGKVVRRGGWGVYFCTPDGHLGFIDAVEMSWHHSVIEKNIPNVEADIEAVVTRVFAEAQSEGDTFVASVRMLVPSGNPWCEERRPIQGQRLSGVVILVGDGFSCVELATGAVAGVFPSPTDLELGQRVDVVVVSVDPDGKTIAAHLL